MVLIIVAAALGVAAYLGLGLRFAGRPYVTRRVQSQCEEWPALARNVRMVATWRREAAAEALFVSAIWPVALVALVARAVWTHTLVAAPLSAFELQQQLAKREAHIAKLERELAGGGAR